MRNPSTSCRGAAAAGTTKTPCCSKVGLKRGPWTPEEDDLLANYIKKEGEGRWRTLPKRAGLLRCGKSCRLRWMNYLRPSVKRGQIAPDEEDLILRLHRLLGNRWSLIAGRIPGRTDNEIKNYWNTHLSKKLISQGIDPRTHKPLDLENRPNDQQNKASPSKANRKSPTNNNNNNNNYTHSPSGLEETNSGGSTQMMSNKENIYFENTCFNQFHSNANATTNHGFTSLLNYGDSGSGGDIENFGMDLQNNIIIQGVSNEEDNKNNEDMNYCSDDVFSSFLNSLINEEAFASQQQQQQHHQHQAQAVNGIMMPSSSLDPLVSLSGSSTFGIGNGWESAFISSNFSPNGPTKMLNDQLQ